MKSTHINNLELAANQGHISGDMQAQQCDRLLEVIAAGQQAKLNIHYELKGDTNRFHLPSMHLLVNASLPLVCQRCLEPMQLDLSLSFDYVVSESEPEPFDGDEDVDWIESSQEMDLNALIEDELLIAIPYAPMHPDACKPLKMESGEKYSPFSALKDLVK